MSFIFKFFFNNENKPNKQLKLLIIEADKVFFFENIQKIAPFKSNLTNLIFKA